ncbi:DegV family protein [Kroppenstedtia pulmonis]|uniref:DegV family protein n=1 Tax=Kroppenstedtia pulmonis TaxID=1380685 RepID=A0A7D3Y553_9BACL|nr:DegV family protein [Kroppenstedtia pulmonis]QKG84665.1 DegV family protein [Kroppenstedtia pulmonis]
MAKVQVMTDSTADIPEELIEELNIAFIPLRVHMNGETYLDRVSIQPQEFYRKLEKVEEMPTTSQPSPLDFVEAYRKAVNNGATDIISIHLSSSFSGTYQSAVLAQSMVEEEFNVAVIDSKTASFAIGLIVVEVARAAKEGKSLQECIAIANQMIQEKRVFFLVDTLEYLQKGGRIGKAAALLGSLLNIKPILSIDPEGVIIPVDKVRGKRKANARILGLLKDAMPADRDLRAGILYTNNRDEAEKWADRLKENFLLDDSDIVYAEIGPVIGTHVGPGTLAVVMSPR